MIIKQKNIILIVLGLTFAILTGLFIILEFSMLERVILPIFTALILCTGLYIIFNKYCQDKFCSKIFAISILIHFIFLLMWQLIKYYLLGLPMPTELTFAPFVSDNDGCLYHFIGTYISKHYNMTVLAGKYFGGLFPIIIGTIYHFLTNNPFIVCLLNSTVAGFSAVLFYLISKDVFQDKTNSKIYTLITILCTSHILNTSVLIRDSYIVFFIYLSIYLAILTVKRKNLIYFITMAGSIFMLYKFRPYAACVVLFAVIIAYIVSKLSFSVKNKKFRANKLGIAFVIFAPIILVSLLFVLNYFVSSISILSSFSTEGLIEIRDVAYTGSNSDYSWDFLSLYNKFFLLPYIVGYLCLFLAPFPWEWIYVKRIHFIPDMLVLYLMLPSFFKNLIIPFKTKNYTLLVYVFAIFFMFSIYCITVGNSGAIHRLRGPYIPMIYLIAMVKPRPLLRKVLDKINRLEII